MSVIPFRAVSGANRVLDEKWVTRFVWADTKQFYSILTLNPITAPLMLIPKPKVNTYFYSTLTNWPTVPVRK